MFRTCPATGRLAHRFDPATHRCKCGRWERGFKPKCEPVKPRAECQICERQQALTGAGVMGHHGYKRPGVGFIFGDCMGVGHKPYTATDALVKYLGLVVSHLAKCQAELESLPTVTEFSYVYEVREAGQRERVKKAHTVRKGDERESGRFPEFVSFPSFETLYKSNESRLLSEIDYATHDKNRVEKRIAAAA